jgi:hypothetical protein
MRWYSIAEQLPWAIIRLRWKIVSHDAAVSLAIMIGRANGELWARLFMTHEMRIADGATRGMRRDSMQSPAVFVASE